MTNSRQWVSVSTAAKILKVSRRVIDQKMKDGKLIYRKPGEKSTQITRISICQVCLSECFPNATDFPLNCDTCHYFRPSQQKKQSSPI